MCPNAHGHRAAKPRSETTRADQSTTQIRNMNEAAGARTQGLRIKSPLLYRLSYSLKGGVRHDVSSILCREVGRKEGVPGSPLASLPDRYHVKILSKRRFDHPPHAFSPGDVRTSWRFPRHGSEFVLGRIGLFHHYGQMSTSGDLGGKAEMTSLRQSSSR